MLTVEEEVELYIDKMNELMAVIDVMTTDNFDDKKDHLFSLVNDVKHYDLLFKNKYTEDEMFKFYADIQKTTKDLKRKFDNLIEIVSSELRQVSAELNSLNNQKKLSKYTG